jgi:PAS domain S-box-containing protein
MAATLLLVVLAWGGRAFAQNADLDISQFAHSAWRVRDGFTKGTILSIAQTPDGYLWLGTEFGLVRFDGIRCVAWKPPSGQHLPSDYISTLLVAHDGTLWIGTLNGLASWKNGAFTRHTQLEQAYVLSLIEDSQQTIWIGTSGKSNKGRLCASRGGKIDCLDDGAFGETVDATYQDHEGNLWVAGQTGLWRWSPGPPIRYQFPSGEVEVNALLEGDTGGLMIAANDGLKQLVSGTIEELKLPGVTGQSWSSRFLGDRDGSLWIGTDRGLVHVHHGIVDRFRAVDGLSGDRVSALFQDREGSIWVATANGLDRFREYAIPTLTSSQGLSSSDIYAVQAMPDGSVWVATTDGLNHWQSTRVVVYRSGRDFAKSSPAAGAAPQTSRLITQISNSGLEGTTRSLNLDDDGRLWAVSDRGVFYLDHERFLRVPELGGNTSSTLGDGRGNVWILEKNRVFFWSPDRPLREISLPQFSQNTIRTELADPATGGLWLGFFQGGLVYVEDGKIVRSYGEENGFGGGRVNRLRFVARDEVLAATEHGLSRIKKGHIATLTSRNGLPCDEVYWSIEDDEHNVWLYMPCGLVRLPRAEWSAWTKDPQYVLRTKLFDTSDGVRSVGLYAYHASRVTTSPDGKLWFSPSDGVSVIDAHHLPSNTVPPPVHIERVVANDKEYAVSNGLRIPPQVRSLFVDYTALSLVAPEKVHFRYRLKGQDQNWKEVINDRRVQYSNLPPGSYRFRVIACNNDGVWNETGDALEFAILPAYYQTTWFRLLCVAAFFFLLWVLYQLRLRKVELQFDTKLAERARIVQELRTIIDSIPGFVCAMSAKGEIELLNKRLLEYFGKTFEEMKAGWATSDSIHPEDRARSFELYKHSIQTGTPHEYEQRYRRADGVYRWFHRSACPVRDTEGHITGWYALMTDIEDRKRAEDELQRKEAFLAEGQHISSTGTFSWRLDTDEVALSREGYRIFDLDLNAPVTLEQIGKRVHHDDQAILSDRIMQARAAKEIQDYEVRLRMEDESVKYLQVSSHRTHRQDGGVEYIGAIQDVTQRRLAEESVNELRSELTHMARVASLGVLTASITHEVSQPLFGIMTNASTTLRMLGADPPNLEGAMETTRRTIRDGKRASEVIVRLRELFHKKDPKIERIDLNEAAREVLMLCSDEFQKSGVNVRQEFTDGLPHLAGDRVQLQQVILNLLRNASDAMIRVTDGPKELAIRTETDGPDNVCLKVRDTGEGIREQDAKALFKAFYTTKPDGMGIGLAVSQSIIERHGGRIWATTNDGPGATFAFSIPFKAVDGTDGPVSE